MTYAGGGLSYTQSYTYDSLNRLQTAQENSGSSWSQTNGYDQYGNRWIDYGGGVHSLAFSTTTNRITTGGYSYDTAGNLTNDGNHTYIYDAENKINGCNAGKGGWGSIAGKLANHLDRTVWAFNGPTKFYTSPNAVRGSGGKDLPRTGPLYLMEDRGTRFVPYRP